jgi:Uncharacterized protein family UPF0029
VSDDGRDPARYPVPAQQHRVEQVIDRSRFICTVARVQSSEEAQAFIKTMNAEFPDATHNCWAYVVGAPGSTDRVGMSDDGEPHGTAGRPMLTVLLHSGVGEIAAVVTRYYGGTKLGTGGLVKAYSGAVQEALAGMPRPPAQCRPVCSRGLRRHRGAPAALPGVRRRTPRTALRRRGRIRPSGATPPRDGAGARGAECDARHCGISHTG